MTENQESNKRLFEWINPDGCWHDWRSMGSDWGYRCGKCGVTGLSARNPDYCSDASPRSLLNEVVAKVPSYHVWVYFLNESMPIWDGCPDDCEGAHLLTATAEQIARACVEAHKGAKR